MLFKKIKKAFISFFCVAVLACTGFVAYNIGNVGGDSAYATLTSSGYKNIGDILLSNYATSSTMKFNGTTLQSLYQQITGNANATFTTVSNLAPTGNNTNWLNNVVNSATFRAKNKTLNGTTYGNDIQLTFGGQVWTAVELFKDSNGQVCLALMLKDATSTKYAWSSGFANVEAGPYNSNLYGTSYMRAAVLNNGGNYAIAKGNLSGVATQSSSSAWAKFTMSSVSGSLTNYLVTPATTFQQSCDYTTALYNSTVNSGGSQGGSYFFNSNWGVPANFTYHSLIRNGGYTNSSSTGASTYGQIWKDDYVWLPSLCEISVLDDAGRWGLSPTQMAAGSAYWLRSTGNFNGSSAPYQTVRYASITSDYATVDSAANAAAAGVRPCIFLNLTKAEAAKGTSITTPTNVSATYTGSSLTSAFTSASWYSSSRMTISYNTTTYDYKSAGSHVATVTAKSGYFFGSDPTKTSVNVTLTVNKKAVTAPVNKSYAYDGFEHKFEAESWYNSSVMTITPTNTDYNYRDVNLYTATVKLTDSNYYFSGLPTTTTSTSVSIEITKKIITKPNVQDIIYDGVNHGFKTRAWWDPNLMTLSLTDEQDNIVNVGTYTATLSLPNDNYRWSDGDSRTTEVVTTIKPKIITPADITFEYDGNEHKASAVESQTWFDSANLTMTFGDGNFTDVGEYVVNLTSTKYPNVVFSGNTNSSTWQIKIIVEKRKVNVKAFEIDPETSELTPTSVLEISETLSDRDKGTNKEPKLALRYSADGGVNWTTEVPDHAGQYTVEAYITNPDTCNYVLASAGRTTFERHKGLVYMPSFTNDDVVAGNHGAQILPRTIYGWTTQIQYTGKEQVFKLIKQSDGSEPLTIHIDSLTGDGFTYNEGTREFRATKVGVYTVNISLSHPEDEQWDNWADNSSPIRTITLEILKAEIQYEIVDDAQGSWAAGSVDTISIKFFGADFLNQNIRPDISVYAGRQGATELVSKDFYSYETDCLVVSVNIGKYEANQYYDIMVELDSSLPVNKNYQLNSIGKTPTGSAYEFFITTAVIKSLEIEWVYSNPGISTGISVENPNALVVKYNEYEYHVKLNELLLPSGVSASYPLGESGEEKVYKDADTYKIVATLTCDSGSKFDPTIQATNTNVKVTYVSDNTVTVELNLTIQPTDFDLKVLYWQEDLTYNKVKQTMSLANCPTWIRVDDAPGGVNEGINPGTYNAKLKLTPDSNHKFVNSDSTLTWIEVRADGTAYVSHEWHINKIIINVSDRDADWSLYEGYDLEMNWFEYPKPNAIKTYADQLVVTYYYDEALTELIPDISKITIELGKVNWLYAKVELSSETSVTNFYDINNLYNDNLYATVPFKVGDNRSLIEVTFNFGEDGTVYNGQGQAVVVSCPDLSMTNADFKVVYYIQDNEGNYTIVLGDGELPKNVGNYLAVISFVDGSSYEQSYNIRNKRFEFAINKLILDVEWDENVGREVPEFSVYAVNSDLAELDAFYSSTLLDFEGNPFVGDLKYNTLYKMMLTATDANVEFASEAETLHEFRTELNPDGDYVELDSPVFVVDSYVWNGADITFEIADWDNLKNYLEITSDSDSLVQKNVDSYSVTLRFKQDVNATWVDGTNADVTLTFEIVKLVVAKPTLPESGEKLTFEFDGLNAEYFPVGFASDLMEIDGNSLEALGQGTMTISLLDTNNMVWDDDSLDPIVVDYVVVKRGLDRPTISQIDNKGDYTYNGEEISYNLDVDLLGYNSKFMTVTGDLTGLNADTYQFTVSLIYKEYTYWKDASEELPEGGEDEEVVVSSIRATEDVEDITLEWQIFKAEIVGEWNTEGKYPVFIPADESMKDLYDVKYFAVDENGDYKLDENGEKIEVDPENMVVGDNYKAEIVLKDPNNYQVVGEDSEEIDTEKDFVYAADKKGFFEKAWDFIKKNWLWFVIGLASLILMIIVLIIIIIVARRKKKEELEKQQDEENASEEQKNGDDKKETQSGDEKVEAQNKANQNAQMNNGFANGQMPNMFGGQNYGVPPQYQGFYYGQPQQSMIYGQPQQNGFADTSKQDLEREIQELREQVKELKKDKLARDEGTNQDKKLVKDEDKLIKYILENFDNLPSWLPFNKQDLIDHPVEDIIKLYETAKQLSKENISQRNGFNQFLQGRLGDYSNSKLREDEKSLETQLKEIDDKLADYRKIKSDIQYETRLKQLQSKLTKLDASNKSLQKVQEEQRKDILEKLKNKKND